MRMALARARTLLKNHIHATLAKFVVRINDLSNEAVDDDGWSRSYHGSGNGDGDWACQLKIDYLNFYLSAQDEQKIVSYKLERKHRSAKFIRDKLQLRVHRETVRQILVRHHLSRITLSPVKPIERFEGEYPNALWQISTRNPCAV
jgi:hypothetical protein